jgi:peptidoglycan L-alanyl-D-glutamate endopeptidase CwlK
MPRFGSIPREIPVERRLAICAPAFCAAVEAMLASLEGGLDEYAFETLRTEERQSFLFGFGRNYDDGRGRVTNASSALSSWHGFGLAVDVVEKDATPWDAPVSFWNDIGDAAERHGLTWGGRWSRPDLPHVQWGKCPVSPTDADRELFRTRGMQAVWAKYGADVVSTAQPPAPPRVVWSVAHNDYLIVVRYTSDTDWSYVKLQDLARQPASKGTMALSACSA